MEKRIRAQLNASGGRVHEVLADLEAYPQWLEIVTRADPAAPSSADSSPAWMVTLSAKLGPLARSKRLRMVRVVAEPDHLRFERRELDGRDHADWVLDVMIEDGQPCSVEVTLSYSGGLWSKPLEAVLGSQVTDAVSRLQALVTN